MSAEEFDVDLEYLISLVRERPSLWDKTSEDFSNRFQRASEWAAICNILFIEYEDFDDAKKNRVGNDIIKKWRSVKDNFFRYVKKQKENRENRASGIPTKKMKKYHFYNQLQFLLKVAHHNSDLQQEGGNSSTNRTPAMEPLPSPTATAPGAGSKRPHSGLDDNETGSLGTREEREERHMLFFRAIMPSITNCNELQILQFQERVLHVIKEIRFGPQTESITPSISVGYPTAGHQQVQQQSIKLSPRAAYCNQDREEEELEHLLDFPMKIEKI